jgi:hypothetical protein
MARVHSQKRRKSRARHFTPPRDLSTYVGQPKTPQRANVLFAKALSQRLNIPIPQDLIRDLTGVPPRNQTRILSSKQVRTFHNRPDSGPDPRGKKRALARSDTAAIANYLNDPHVSLNDKGKLWQDIAEAAGVELPDTYHFKPAGFRTISAKGVRQSCKRDEGIINAVCKEEKELSREQYN